MTVVRRHIGIRLTTAARLWAHGVALGLRTLPGDPVLGFKRLLLPVTYWRTAEFAYVLRHLDGIHGGRILDLGSPKQLAPLVARRTGAAVVSTDILAAEVREAERYAEASGLAGDGPGRVRCEVQDGRALTYASATFAAAFAVSVVEHIPDDGDTLALMELVRVVEPGGLVLLSVPFDTAHRDTYVAEDVFERARTGDERLFFERHYDEQTLRTRLIDPPAAELVDLEYWGEGRVRVERFLNALGRAAALVHPVEAFVSAVFLRPVATGPGLHRLAAFLTLRKPLT